jgi:nicotinate-nucleotide adenylyltransferase
VRAGGARGGRFVAGDPKADGAGIAAPATGILMPEPRSVIPSHAPGMRIGLFGGSFNPPHAAHRAASLFAVKRLHLDRIWWLVTPGNPLKDTSALPPLATRMAAARALARHPRIEVTGLEAVIKTRYTSDTVAYLIRHCPSVRFVWVMGADNLKQFHRWQNWRRIVDLVPVAVVDRAPASLRAMASPAAQALAFARIPESAAETLADRPPPAWVFLHGLKSPLSSTALRSQKTPPLEIESVYQA